MEYYYWEGNMVVRKKSLIEIRKNFIQRHSRTEATNIFARGESYPVGRIWWAGGSWNYKNYGTRREYELDERGKTKSSSKSLRRW